MGLGLGEHAFLIGQIHAAHIARHQRIAHGFGLGAVAHQDGDVVGLQRPERLTLAKAGDALFGAVEQVGNLGGTTGGLLVAILPGADRRVTLLHPQGDAGFFLLVDQQHILAALGLHRLEGDGVVHHEHIAEGTLAIGEQMVDGIHHGAGGAEVPVQGVVLAFGGAARFQVGEHVGAAEGINGLFGIADHEPAGAFFLGIARLFFIERGENTVLGRVGVLEFVDQRHRELIPNHLGQALAVAARECLMQAAEHVVEAHGGGLAAQAVHPLVNPGGHMGKQIRAWQGIAGLTVEIGIQHGR